MKDRRIGGYFSPKPCGLCGEIHTGAKGCDPEKQREHTKEWFQQFQKFHDRPSESKYKIGSRKIPVIPPLPPGEPHFDSNATVAICGECGLHLKGMMNYNCGNARCPTGLGPTTTC